MLSIKEPCSQDWEQMKIGVSSRFCDHCEKSVIDFTTFTRAEILAYLLSRKNQKVCGRLPKSVVDFTIDDLYVTVEAIAKEKKQPKLAFYLLTTGALFLASCNSEVETLKQAPQQLQEQADSINAIKNSSLLPKKDTLKKKCDTSLTHKVERVKHKPIPIEDFVTGDIAIEIDPPIDHPDSKIPRRPLRHVEVMPEFKGGYHGLMNYLKKEIKYPKKAKEKELEGTVYVRFVVDTFGKVTAPYIMKGISPDSLGFNEEVLTVISNMPNWKLGMNRGKKVEVEIDIPVRFKLNN